jgi:Leucine-rich repeat (LRR) protein
VLNLSYNKLTSVPESIAKLTLLTTLVLSFNRIAEIPQSIIRLNIANLDVSRQTGVQIKTKPLEHRWDSLFVVVHVVMGYVDLVTACSSCSSGRTGRLPSWGSTWPFCSSTCAWTRP